MNDIVSQITQLGDWGRHGLGGMVIAALFIQTIWFMKAISKKDESNQEFISNLLSSDRSERKEARMEHRDTTNRLAGAIDELTKELRGGAQVSNLQNKEEK